MKRADQKSHCAVNFALEAIGDPWSLLIVRDIAFDGKHTFKEFLGSEERIATNVLTDRLNRLQQIDVISKHQDPTDRRVSVYTLTEKGIDLIPSLFELSKWSYKYDPKSAASKEFTALYDKDPQGTIKRAQATVREGRALFASEESKTNTTQA